jgi:hypothetical protein
VSILRRVLHTQPACSELAASNRPLGVMVLLGKQLGLDLDGMRPTLRDASAFSARGSCDSRNASRCYRCLNIIHPQVMCVNPARRKGLSDVVE